MKHLRKGFLFFLLVVASFIAIYPFVLMIFGSFKTPAELSMNPAGWPLGWTLQNYRNLFAYNSGTMLRAYWNSLFITATYLLLSVFICSLAAYAFAKFKFKGRNLMFVALLCTIMVPGEVLLPPLYLMFAKFQWINTYQVQIIPGVANVFGLFLLRQYIIALPDSVLEAARIEGMGEFGIYQKIVLPMSSPVIGAFMILQGLAKWSEYLWPKLLVTNPLYQPLMVVLSSLNNAETSSVFIIPYTLQMAGCAIATLPIFILFIIFQDKVMQSVTLGAVKE